MITAQQKYNANDRELLGNSEDVKHFRHMLEARHFVIYTEDKPLTYAFSQKRDKCSKRQFNHLDFISQFMTDIRHISGQDSVVADALSRVEAVCASVISRHITTPLGNFALPTSRFQHVHVDIVGPLPKSDAFRYCLTVVDRFTRWPETIPLPDITAETIDRALLYGWITRFGFPQTITTNQGRQFESQLFHFLATLCGIHVPHDGFPSSPQRPHGARPP